MRRFLVWLGAGGLVALAGVPSALSAQGFSVNEYGACAMARAGTAVADPCPDGSAIFYNPAGVANAEKGRWTIAVGGTFIAPRGTFTNDATGLVTPMDNNIYPVPQLYITGGLTNDVSAGIGLYAPYGLTTEWSPNGEAQFLGYKSVIRAIYVQPTLAAKVGKYIKVGAGFDINFFHVELAQHLDLSAQQAAPGVTFGNLGIPTGTAFANVDLTGNATGVGYHVGAIFQPDKHISFGIRYLSRQKVTVDNGTAAISQVGTGLILAPNNPLGAPAGTPVDSLLAPQFRGAGPLQTQGAKTAVRMPEQFVGGVMIKPVDKLKVLFDVTWQNWKVFDTLAIVLANLPEVVLPENFGSTVAYRFGAEYELSSSTALRAGYLRHDGAEPTGSVTPNLPEGARAEFTAGLGTRLTGDLHLDLAYQYINQQARRGRTVPFGQPDNGLYSFKASLVGATLAYTF